MAKPRPSLSDAFECRYIPEPMSGCWLWIGEVDRDGYGQYVAQKIKKSDGNYIKKRIKAHRISWQLHCGPIPEGMEVCHECDNPVCVNPDHLFVGSHADNMVDRDRKNRVTHGQDISWSKLTVEQVLAIRGSRESGALLAARHGVSFQTISEVRLGKTWSRA